jgi:hypothetical protein
MFKVKRLQDHTRWAFFDEKHLVNKDTLPGKARANPLTSQVDAIGVSGGFRNAFNLIAAISCNMVKSRPMVYTMGKKNGTSVAFMAFICSIGHASHAGWKAFVGFSYGWIPVHLG